MMVARDFSIQFVIHGDPVPFARAGSNGRRRFTPPRQRDYMDRVRNAAIKAKGRHAIIPGDVPVMVLVEASWAYPKSFPAASRKPQWRAATPDADNVGKLLTDACNGIIYEDDSQIAAITVVKKYGPTAGVTATFAPMQRFIESPS